MASINFGNGQVVELSKETTERLKKELLKPEPPKGFSYVVRNLAELVILRNQLNIFIDYLEEN